MSKPKFVPLNIKPIMLNKPLTTTVIKGDKK